MITIIDYGAGNLHSIRRAIEMHSEATEITSDPDRIAVAERLILPGVGNAKAAMDQLRSTGIAAAIRERAAHGTPLLGVCLGMQLLFGDQEEGPTTGLGILPGHVARLTTNLKVPHMGWNTVYFQQNGPLGELIPQQFYFVHSYKVVPDDPAIIAGETDYGDHFTSLVIHDNVWGCQFHPEKSATAGLELLGRWLQS